ncbi:MAG: hypothetical protein ACR2QC_11495 [Gammaproteobacteria bacterium]
MLKLKGGAPSGTKGASFRQSRRDVESAFSSEEYEAFDAKLRDETQMARSWGAGGRFPRASAPPTLGCEVESCLAGADGLPAPESANFMEYFSNDNGYYEMTKYNVEFEIAPCALGGAPFSEMYDALEHTRRHAARCADMVGANAILCGILPSFAAAHFSADMITDRLHFRTLEKQLRKLNCGRPFAVNIGYGDGLRFEADNLSVEGAATSLQIHLSVAETESAAFYNAAQIAAAVTVGVAANSPFFMGKQLWAETRVPLFEQIMYERFVGQNARTLPYGRRCDDIFGGDYLRGTLLELFSENHARMPAVLPIARDTPPEKMMHLILHNRDILRWNRPVLGFSNGRPFLRIEHRAMSSGPTTADMTANMALFVGLACHLHRAFVGATAEKTIARMPFETARDNFYRAARDGLDADIVWLGESRNLREFVAERALEYAKRGLRDFGVDEADLLHWLDIIERRVRTGQNGSIWQRRYAAKHGGDETGMRRMVAAYLQKQEEGAPVHTWTI